MKNPPLRPLLAGLVILALLPTAYPQTATWIGNTATSDLDWNDGSQWDTGVAPNSPTAIAVIRNLDVAPSYPGGGIKISSTTVDLAELRFGGPAPGGPGIWNQRVHVTAPFALPPVWSILNLHGVGLTTEADSGGVSIGMGSQLHFYNRATISGSTVFIGLEAPYSGFSGSVHFHDQSSAADANLNMAGVGTGSVIFHDQSTAATAYIRTDNLTFADQSSAGSAYITTYAFGEMIYFKDQSTAADATIYLSRYGGVVFSDQATTGNVTVSCSVESSGVFVRDLADVSGLTVRSIVYSDSPVLGGYLDIHQAAGDVTIRGVDGGIAIYLGSNTLTLGPAAGDQSLQGRIDGTGGLVFNTGRVVTVTGSGNTYTGPTEVRSGTLNLAGGRVSATTVASGARLTGAGIVDGPLVNAGVVSPGNSAGIIRIEGDFIQNPTGLLGIEINSPTEYDQLVVGGTATLGGTLNLTGSGGLAPVGNATFAFLSAGAVSGRFDLVTPAPGLVPGLGAARTAQLVYANTGVSYQVTQAALAGFGGTSPAATALGAHLDANLANSAGEFRTLLGGLNSLATSADVGTALEALTPDRYSVLAEQAFALASARRAATDRRLAAVRSGSARDSGLFFEAGTRAAVFKATGPLPEARSRLDRGTVGGLWRREAVSLGAALTFETGRVDLDQAGSTDDLRSVTPEIYVQYDAGSLFLNASIARSGDDHDLRRRIVYAGQDQTATASVGGSRLDFAVTGGCAFTAGAWTITPVAGFAGSEFKTDAFAESGAAGANLAFAGWTSRSFRSHAGMEATRQTGRFTHRLALRWLHEFNDDRSLLARFAGDSGGSFRAPGRPAETDLGEAVLAVHARLGEQAVGSLSVGAAWGRRSRLASDLTAAVNWRF